MPDKATVVAALSRIDPRLADATWVAGGLFLSVLAAKTPWAPFPWQVVLLAGATGSAALWWRRRRPLEATAVAAVGSALSGNPFPALVGIGSLATRRRDVTLVAMVVLVAVALAFPEWVDLGGITASALTSNGGFAAVAVAIGVYLGIRTDQLEALRGRASLAETERELRVEQARAAERARIAREMHDVLAHKVSLIALHAGALEVNPEAGAARVSEVAGLIGTTARQTLEELRAVLGVLRADGSTDGTDLAPQAQAADVGRLVESSREAGVAVALVGDVPELPDATARAVHRIVREGLTNVHKHARGARAEVSLSGDPAAGVTVAITNAASVGGATLPGSGVGIIGLGERTRLLGGSLRAGPEPGGGWRLEAWLPWGDRVRHADADPVAPAAAEQAGDT